MNVIEPRAEGRGTDVLVAVVDTGVELDHPDLAPHLVPGYDYTGSDAAGDDLNGHGTHVAGIIAAMSNDDGFTGIAPEADVLPISVLDEDGFGFSYAVAQGVLTAVDMGADIINLSLSGPELSADLRHALDYADEHGVVVIASAGNGAGLLRRYPAAAEGVLAVSSIDRAKTLVESSSFGFHIAFAAPGDDIASISTGGKRVLRSGSSMAAAHVTGAVAALRSQPKWGTLTRLFSTAVDLGEPGVDEQYGVGLIDLAAAFDLEVPAPDDPDTSPTDFTKTTWCRRRLPIRRRPRRTTSRAPPPRRGFREARRPRCFRGRPPQQPRRQDRQQPLPALREQPCPQAPHLRAPFQ